MDLLADKGTLKCLLQHRSSKASILWCSAFVMVQLSHPYMTTGKTIAVTRQTFVGKVILCFLICCLGLSWRRQWHPTPLLLPPKSHGQRSLVGCSPWGREESDTTERLHFDFSLSCTGEGNGSPLQCSCLENPKDGGAWWAAVYGVAQSRTRLKRLSSSSSSRFVTASLPRSQYHLTSWLQLPFAVILEPKKMKFFTIFIVSLSICHEVMGPGAMTFIF